MEWMAWDQSTLHVEWSASYRSVAKENIIVVSEGCGGAYSVVTVGVTDWMVTTLIGILSIPQLQLNTFICYASRCVILQTTPII